MHSAKKPTVILDLVPLLPRHGENSVTLELVGNSARLNIFYDSEQPGKEKKLSLQFDGLNGLYTAAFPGVNITKLQCEKAPLEALVEYEDSNGAKLWSSHFGPPLPPTKHFRLAIQEEGRIYDIFAESVKTELLELETK